MRKYRNHKATIDGKTFDSMKEARHWKELQLLERAGKIQNLQRQVEFELIPEQRGPDTIGPRGGIKKGNLIERKCCYVADFVYYQDGHMICEDVKGYKGGGAYQLFTIKRKLMLWRYGIQIREV